MHIRARGRILIGVVVTLVAATTLVAAPVASAPAVVVDQTCTTAGLQSPTGSPVISGAMLPQITSSSLPISVTATIDATSEVNPGGIVTTTAILELDLAAVAQDILVDRVHPGIVSAGYASLVPTAWDVVAVDDATFSFPLPNGTTAVGAPMASSSGAPVTASFIGSTVQVGVGHLVADTRSPTAAATFTVTWTVADGGSPAPRTLVLHSGPSTFTASVDVGLLFYGAPIVGGVTGPWGCTPVAPAAVLASTAVVDTPVTSPSSTTPASTTTSSSATSTSTSSTTTTTWPSTTTTPPGACAVAGFDEYGGYLGIDLGATGFFRTAHYRERWWIVDPAGHPFFSQGINHVTFDGTPDQFGATPYRDAVVAKYGTREAWAQAQLGRMQDWGYNTLGAWSDTDLFADRVPYTQLLDITDQDFGTGVMEDLWAPAWTSHVQSAVAAKVVPRRDDPYLLGYWTDNELHWGPDWRPVHLFDEYLERDAATSPGKAQLVAFLQARYPTFAAFAAEVTTTAANWGELAGPTTASTWTATGGEATRAAWVGEVARRYFTVTSAAIEAADPNHLNLGPRMMAQVTGTPVLDAAAASIDVASFNDYALIPELGGPLAHADPTYLPVDNGLAAQAERLGKPIIVSEWSFRAADSGLPNTWPPLFPTLPTQAHRAAAYESYASSLRGNPAVVGQHWFEHSDEPPRGRPGGEDSNFGLVDLADEPYAPMTAVSRTMHDCAYAELLAAVTPPTTAPTTLPPSANTVAPAAPAAVLPESTRATPVRAAPSFTG